jgi:hypothetical protein
VESLGHTLVFDDAAKWQCGAAKSAVEEIKQGYHKHKRTRPCRDRGIVSADIVENISINVSKSNESVDRLEVANREQSCLAKGQDSETVRGFERSEPFGDSFIGIAIAAFSLYQKDDRILFQDS